jgi:hypothetical protein
MHAERARHDLHDVRVRGKGRQQGVDEGDRAEVVQGQGRFVTLLGERPRREGAAANVVDEHIEPRDVGPEPAGQVAVATDGRMVGREERRAEFGRDRPATLLVASGDVHGRPGGDQLGRDLAADARGGAGDQRDHDGRGRLAGSSGLVARSQTSPLKRAIGNGGPDCGRDMWTPQLMNAVISYTIVYGLPAARISPCLTETIERGAAPRSYWRSWAPTPPRRSPSAWLTWS